MWCETMLEILVPAQDDQEKAATRQPARSVRRCRSRLAAEAGGAARPVAHAPQYRPVAPDGLPQPALAASRAVHSGRGLRRDATLRLRFMPSTEGGWVDTESGLLYRCGQRETLTAKRRPLIPLARRALAHLKRSERAASATLWRSTGSGWQASRRPGNPSCRRPGLTAAPGTICVIRPSRGRCSAA